MRIILFWFNPRVIISGSSSDLWSQRTVARHEMMIGCDIEIAITKSYSKLEKETFWENSNDREIYM